ncbi:calaxin-like isoform X1 [Stomoxys calcitrans]|uniref:calaxin-like isoform X1 n=1 Tax=Stomoxys calcitrans TaxID=35570 RepID=UPI0027E32B8F|nr:calaxin-like isoform X1 [Stomoxys calcitrans]
MYKLDATLDDVQNTRFFNIYSDLIKQMSKETQFNEMEVQSILLVYHKFVLDNGPKAKSMTIKQFNNLFFVLFKINDMQIIERTLKLITSESQKDVDPLAWVKLLSVFLSSDLEQRMQFAYQIYDVGGKGALTRLMVSLAVENFFAIDDEDELNELRTDMVELIFRKFDVDKDGIISYDDYSNVVRKQPMLLEFLGQCFPNTNDLTIIAYCTNLLSKMRFFEGKLQE